MFNNTQNQLQDWFQSAQRRRDKVPALLEFQGQSTSWSFGARKAHTMEGINRYFASDKER